MSKSFEKVLVLSADEFAAYFNSRVLKALGRTGATAQLTTAEKDRIKEIRRDLYEKLKSMRKPSFVATSPAELYVALENDSIDAAIQVLRKPSRAAAAGAGVGAGAVAAESETSPLGSLNPDSVRSIASYLLPREQVALAKVSKPLNTDLDLKGTLDPRRVKAIKKFLQHVAYGQQVEAEAMLRADRSLLTEAGEFTDYSGRRFICSAYEYAYWAKDTHMCRMLAQVDAEGRSHLDEEMKAILRERIDRMEAMDPETGQAKGLTYWQNEAKHRSAHFDLTPLITALQEYVNGFDAWYEAKNWAAMKAAWLRVGLAQRDIPAHVAQEYGRPDRSFDPTPGFTEATLPRSLSFYNYYRSRDESWFPLGASTTSGLGLDFSLIRAGRSGGAVVSGRAGGPAVGGRGDGGFDLAAMRGLDEVRTADLTQSRDHLNPPATSPGLAR